MSAGLTFIRACVDYGSRSEFQTARREMIAVEEHRVSDFVTVDLRRHGQLPAYPVMLEKQYGDATVIGCLEPRWHTARLELSFRPFRVISPTLTRIISGSP